MRFWIEKAENGFIVSVYPKGSDEYDKKFIYTSLNDALSKVRELMVLSGVKQENDNYLARILDSGDENSDSM